MDPRISPRDLEQLSAYLDGSLTARAKTQLETRLNVESSLATTLKKLQLTRGLLRRAPQRRVPHSFALNRQQASQQVKSFGSWNSFNFASAVASLLLVFTLIGDFSVNGLPVLARAQEAPQALMLEAATAEDMAGATAPSEEPFSLEAPAEGELYAENARDMKGGSPAFAFVANYSSELEAVLASVALLSGLIAIHLRRKRG